MLHRLADMILICGLQTGSRTKTMKKKVSFTDGNRTSNNRESLKRASTNAVSAKYQQLLRDQFYKLTVSLCEAIIIQSIHKRNISHLKFLSKLISKFDSIEILKNLIYIKCKEQDKISLSQNIIIFMREDMIPWGLNITSNDLTKAKIVVDSSISQILASLLSLVEQDLQLQILEELWKVM